tara:strand:+ start:125 stop:337 length:213 start_codon:yes stop_codon:yes gene_type:complete
MCMVAGATDMVVTTHMVTTQQACHIWVAHNHLDTHKETIVIDINLTQLGVQAVMVLVRATVVLEVVKVWS